MNEQVYTTTNADIPVASDEHSLTVGPDGPILLQDVYLVEKMAQFNTERVPERQPDAKGGGAFGRFEVTNDVSAYTKADLYHPGRTSEMGCPAVRGLRRHQTRPGGQLGRQKLRKAKEQQ